VLTVTPSWGWRSSNSPHDDKGSGGDWGGEVKRGNDEEKR